MAADLSSSRKTPHGPASLVIRQGDMARFAGKERPGAYTLAGRTPDVQGVVIWIPDGHGPILEIRLDAGKSASVKINGQAGELINDTSGAIVVEAA